MRKELKTTRWSVDEANAHLGRSLDGDYWRFLIRQVGYREVTFDPQGQAIEFPEYVPLQTLLEEVLERLDRGEIAASQCQVCGTYWDINTDDGIFGDTRNLERFICRPCAERLSAWDFFQRYLLTD
jgi:hypothetical protein